MERAHTEYRNITSHSRKSVLPRILHCAFQHEFIDYDLNDLLFVCIFSEPDAINACTAAPAAAVAHLLRSAYCWSFVFPTIAAILRCLHFLSAFSSLCKFEWRFSFFFSSSLSFDSVHESGVFFKLLMCAQTCYYICLYTLGNAAHIFIECETLNGNRTKWICYRKSVWRIEYACQLWEININHFLISN